jgi:transposase
MKVAGFQEIGSSRGGSNTKVHALVDNQGRPIRLSLTAGQRHDLTAAPDLVEGCTERTILADKAYDSDEFRRTLDGLGLKASIKQRFLKKTPPCRKLLPTHQRKTSHSNPVRKTRFQISCSGLPCGYLHLASLVGFRTHPNRIWPVHSSNLVHCSLLRDSRQTRYSISQMNSKHKKYNHNKGSDQIGNGGANRDLST